MKKLKIKDEGLESDIPNAISDVRGDIFLLDDVLIEMKEGLEQILKIPGRLRIKDPDDYFVQVSDHLANLLDKTREIKQYQQFIENSVNKALTVVKRLDNKKYRKSDQRRAYD
jgi:hypothetical protein